MDRISQLHAAGQSLWYDNIQRRLLENGELATLIATGKIRGVTSNPTIFNNAISKSHDYDAALQPMAWAGWTAEEIFWQLAVEDIQAAADLFRPLYDQSGGGDGFVSLEVSPYLANDTEKTIRDAQKLWERVNRPNLMIKIPATKAGIPAIRKSIAAGINVNVTLIFALDRYAEVMEAYMAGLEDRLDAGLPIDHVSSVASFFVSRVDTKVDGLLQKMGAKGEGLQGQAAVANARLAYQLFLKTITTDRFFALKRRGARLQRPLWASTGTKNPAYSDVLYVEELIGQDTVNTVPPHTLEAFTDHGKTRLSVTEGVEKAQQLIDRLKSLGISMAEVTQALEVEGVEAFADAFTELIQSVDARRKSALLELGPLAAKVSERVKKMEALRAVERFYAHDPLLWTRDPSGQEEIRKRMGWVDGPEKGFALLGEIEQFFAEIQVTGMTHILLLGMGGSSLSPEVMADTFGARETANGLGLELRIVDSTDPGQIASASRWAPVEKTLYIVSSKSGGTAEVNAYLDYFYARAKNRLGKKAGDHFVAITDPGTSMEKRAREMGFRKIFLADPNVGGRYSVLTMFGLVPAVLMGLDASRLLHEAEWMEAQCTPAMPAGRNPGLLLGVIMGEAALAERDKLTVLADPEVATFGSWLEQLVAESSGKNGKGIVPVDLEPLERAGDYSKDRLFVYLRLSGKYDALRDELLKYGQPVLTLNLTNEYSLGAEFYRWCVATAYACSVIGVNSFDQPDVQDSKTRTQNYIDAFHRTGKLQEGTPIWQNSQATLFGQTGWVPTSRDLTEVLKAFLAQSRQGDYIAINAYVPRNPLNFARLQSLRRKIQKLTGRPVTLGFGPRFQHSTGQLHKGGANNGVFVQITCDPTNDFEIPGQNITFGQMEQAQAIGDLDALLARRRRAIRVHISNTDILKYIL